jgi:hypothetical protein
VRAILPTLQNTIDLQWKMRANYNARLCDGERKTAGAGTMASNGKNNAPGNGNSRNSGRVLTSGRDRGKTGNARASRCQTDWVRWQDLRMSLGAERRD